MRDARLRQTVDTTLALAAFAMCFFPVFHARAQTALLNVSYDPTRELYKAVNAAFQPVWEKESG